METPHPTYDTIVMACLSSSDISYVMHCIIPQITLHSVQQTC